MKKTQISHTQSEYLLFGHSNECTVSRTTFFDITIPKELEAYSQWIFCKPKKRSGRLTKVPYTVQSYTANTTDPRTWTYLEDVSPALSEDADTYSNPSFVLTYSVLSIFHMDYIIETVTGESDPGDDEESII